MLARVTRPLAALAAVTYVTVIGLSGTTYAQEPGDEPDALEAAVTVDTRPRWGQGPAGAWAPYVTTVRNNGLTDIEGVVVLTPVPPPAPGSDPGPFGQPDTNGVVLAPVAVLGMEDRPDEERADGQLVAAPQAWPLYRTTVTLAAQSEKAVTTVLLEAPFGYRAEYRDLAGKLVASQPDRASVVVGRSTWNVAFLGTAGDELLARSGLNITSLGSGIGLSADALEMSGLQAVIINDFDSASLTAAQLSTLKTFVGLGGHLILGGGSAWKRTLEALPDELVPLRPTATVEASFAPLGTPQVAVTVAGSVATGDLKHGQVLVQDESGPPLVVESSFGSGQIVQLTFNPFAEPLASDIALAAAALEAAKGPVFERLNLDMLGPPPEDLWGSVLDRPLVRDQPKPWSIWPRWSMIVAGTYVALLVPLTYTAFRTRRRRDLAWVAIPATALLLSGMMGLASPAHGGTAEEAVNSVEIAIIGPDGSALVTGFYGVVAPQASGSADEVNTGLRPSPVPPGAAAASVLAEPWTPQQGIPRVPTSQTTAFAQPAAIAWSSTFGFGRRLFAGAADNSSAAEIVALDAAIGAAEVRSKALAPDRVQTVQTIHVAHDRGGIDGVVRVSGAGSSQRVSGQVTNNTGRRLRSLLLRLPTYDIAVLTDRPIDSGASATFDAPVTGDQTRQAIRAAVRSFDRQAPNSIPTFDEADQRALSAAVGRIASAPGQALLAAVVDSDPRDDEARRTTTIEIVMTALPLTAG